MGGYPSDYYIMPDHQIKLSSDRKKVYFMQPLPLVKKSDLDVEVHKNGVCLDFNPERKNPVHKCITLLYEIDPSTAKATFKDGVLNITADFAEAHMGTKVKIE